MKVRVLAIGLVFAALSAAAGARAQTAVPAATVTSSALPLELVLGKTKLDAEAVRKSIELELKRPVALTVAPADTPSLTVVAHENHTVTVSYRTNTGSVRSRSIGIPDAAARGAEVIALLSGNLSRDEAAELLADLGAKGAPPPEAVTATGDAPATTTSEAAPKSDAASTPSAAATRPPPSPQRAQPSAPPPLLETPLPAINLSLAAPVALYQPSEQRIFSAELGLFYSHVGELHGAGLNLFVLHTERDVRGMSYATFYNYTSGAVSGFSLSAIFNRRLRLRGAELAGVLNIASGDSQGCSVAGVTNLAHDFEGMQAAGALNWADTVQGMQAAALVNRTQGVTGMQAAGLVNWAAPLEGAQAAGLLNWADAVQGVQVAGLVNWADGLEGMQAAGLYNRATAVTGVQAAGAVNVADSIAGLQLGVVNVAGNVKGLQVGVINVAKHVDGTSIGLVSVADNGRVQPVLWASSSLPINAAAKFTIGPLYTQAGLGYAPGNQTYTYELGLGGHFRIGRFFVEPGVHYSEMRSTQHPFDHELIEFGHYRIAAGLDLNRISPFAGAGVLQRFAHSSDAPASVPVSAEVFGGVAFF